MSNHVKIRQGREVEFVQVLGVLTGQLLVEGLCAVRATEIIGLAADARTHGVRSRNIRPAYRILNHVIMSHIPVVRKRWLVEFPQGFSHQKIQDDQQTKYQQQTIHEVPYLTASSYGSYPLLSRNPANSSCLSRTPYSGMSKSEVGGPNAS